MALDKSSASDASPKLWSSGTVLAPTKALRVAAKAKRVLIAFMVLCVSDSVIVLIKYALI